MPVWFDRLRIALQITNGTWDKSAWYLPLRLHPQKSSDIFPAAVPAPPRECDPFGQYASRVEMFFPISWNFLTARPAAVISLYPMLIFANSCSNKVQVRHPPFVRPARLPQTPYRGAMQALQSAGLLNSRPLAISSAGAESACVLADPVQ